MRVSVIIPVYNAARFVERAVHSALQQEETGEVLLIEDSSTDASLQVCQKLARTYPTVKLYRHPDGRNHGAAASRNIGIAKAQCDYIAFLDADDYFLPGRFTEPKRLFAENPGIDGVYEALGYDFENDEAKRRWFESDPDWAVWMKSRRQPILLTTMDERVAPDLLFEAQSPIGSKGYIATGGWVVTRRIFKRTGLFDEHMRLDEDTIMHVKFAALGRMLPGRLETPVTMRGVYADHRVSQARSAKDDYSQRLRMWISLWRWSRRGLESRRRDIIYRRLLGHALSPVNTQAHSRFVARMLMCSQIAALLVRYPDILFGLRSINWWHAVKRVASLKGRVRTH